MLARTLVFSILAGILCAVVADAKGRRWGLWMAIGFLVPPLFVLLLFLPNLKGVESATYCPSCGGVIMPGQRACPRCRSTRPIDMVECGGCGRFVPKGERCPSCGRET